MALKRVYLEDTAERIDFARDKLCKKYGYPTMVPNDKFDSTKEASPDNPQTIPNPLSKEEWVMQKVVYQWILGQVQEVMNQEAADVARQAAEQFKAQQAHLFDDSKAGGGIG